MCFAEVLTGLVCGSWGHEILWTQTSGSWGRQILWTQTQTVAWDGKSRSSLSLLQHLIWDGTFLYWTLITSLPFLTDKIQILNGSQKNGLSIPTIYAHGHKSTNVDAMTLSENQLAGNKIEWRNGSIRWSQSMLGSFGWTERPFYARFYESQGGEDALPQMSPWRNWCLHLSQLILGHTKFLTAKDWGWLEDDVLFQDHSSIAKCCSFLSVPVGCRCFEKRLSPYFVVCRQDPLDGLFKWNKIVLDTNRDGIFSLFSPKPFMWQTRIQGYYHGVA